MVKACSLILVAAFLLPVGREKENGWEKLPAVLGGRAATVPNEAISVLP